MKSTRCPISGDNDSELIFSYNSPPIGEMKLDHIKSYKREVRKFKISSHYINVHSFNLDDLYSGSYVDSTYKNSDKLVKTFKKIISLPEDKSDNIGRYTKIENFANLWFNKKVIPSLLDVGSGLGVFPYIVNKNGWDCTAIDPDPRSISHIKNNLDIKGICGDFNKIKPTKKFDIITFNKVLEHVKDPIKMLSLSIKWLKKGGFVYIEIPDGEMSEIHGKGREEFFLEHYHIFSITSTAIMASKAGYKIEEISRLQEPSSKFTIRAFLSKI
tara:strand:- start:89 stop:901 length:813 start_codon:yes stop_codon:yes gene_type:complete